MKNSIQKHTLIAGALIISSLSIAQKKNETSAAVEFKNKYPVAMSTGDLETAKKALIAAKRFIDSAAVHPDTKESPKTLWLKGEIYSSFVFVGMQAMDTNFIKLAGDDALDISIAAFKKGYEISDKFDGDIRESVYQKHDLLDINAGMLYQAERYKEAAEIYDFAVNYFNAIGQLDSTLIWNAALCYEKANDYGNAAKRYAQLAKIGYRGTTTYLLASNAYRKNKQIELAKETISEGRKKFPLDRELLLELVNMNIDAGDAVGAEVALSEAISADPKNKQLHFMIGTIYIDLKQNEKAEESLNKALTIDPDYTDVQFQLGAHLVAWGSDTETAAKQLKLGDSNYDKMLKEADDIYKRALEPLEKYVIKKPVDKEILTILFQLHKKLGNTEKALEYKKRAEAVK